ncbi:MAG: menaquinone biosynthesis protein [Chitinophagaceae bacterium]|nr:menaquinone biosynthesis protein [Chitinophagaceae bacterium]
MERKIRIGAVSYLNTKPLLYGLEHGQLSDQVELVLDYPANLVRLLNSNQIDIGLIPVGALPSLGDYHIISDYCIGTEGEVASVAVFSEVPMEEIDTVLLDYQSRTSVMLCKILFEKHWKKKVQFIDAKDESYIENIRGNVAGLMIGDRALKIRDAFKYIFDLGLGWKEMTGLPFVFAVWVRKKEISGEFIPLFNEANGMGLSKINLIIDHNNESSYPMDMYFRKNISYRLTEDMRESMSLYLSYLKNI